MSEYELESPTSTVTFCAHSNAPAWKMICNIPQVFGFAFFFFFLSFYTYIYIKENKISAAYLYLKSRFPLRQNEIVRMSHLMDE